MNAYALSDMHAQLTHVEIDLLKEMAKTLSDSPYVINIGAGFGTSGLALLEARDDLFLFSVDKYQEASPRGLDAEKWAFDQAGISTRRYRQILGDSFSIGQAWKVLGWGVDLVFIDGDHSYEGVTQDIAAWLPNIACGGLIVFHDYYTPLHGGDSGKAIDAHFDAKTAVFKADYIIAFKVK